MLALETLSWHVTWSVLSLSRSDSKAQTSSGLHDAVVDSKGNMQTRVTHCCILKPGTCDATFDPLIFVASSTWVTSSQRFGIQNFVLNAAAYVSESMLGRQLLSRSESSRCISACVDGVTSTSESGPRASSDADTGLSL